MNLLALAFVAVLSKLVPSPGVPSLPSQTHTLDNGLTVVLHRDRTVPLIAVRVLYRVGSADDPAGKQGMVHLMEHALFHGSEHLNGTTRKELARIAAVRSNGSTTPDFMQLYEVVPAANLGAVLRLESDRMGFYRFDSTRIGIEKQIVNREMIERAQRNPWGNMVRAAHGKLYGSTHPLHPASVASVAPISVPDLEAIAATALAPNNAVLALAGDLPPDTLAQVERYFAGLTSKQPPPPRNYTPVTLTSQSTVSIAGGRDKAPRTLVAWQAPSARDHEAPIASLTASILHRRFTKHRNVSPQIGTGAYEQFTWHTHSNAHATFMVAVSGRTGTSPEALEKDIDQMLAELVSEPPSDLELRSAKKHFAISILRQMDTLEMRAEVLAESAAVGETDVVASRLSALQHVTSDQVATFTRDRLLGQPGRVVVLQHPGVGS